MFFDQILLSREHRGQFGYAWMAGTIGVKKIAEKTIIAIDVVKLCDHLMQYIISNSTSPKKRFSLRLSAILLVGTIRIWNRQTLIVEAEVIRVIQTTSIPRSINLRVISRARGRDVDSSSPLTPIAKVKSKRRNRVHLTPFSEGIQQLVPTDTEVPLVLPEPEEVLCAVLPSSDLITLREEAPRQAPLEDRVYDFGAVSLDELQAMGVDTDFISRPRPSSSSSDIPVQSHVVVTVAQVHAEKDGDAHPEPTVEQAPSVEVPEVPRVEAVETQVPPVEGVETQITPMELVETIETRQPRRRRPLVELQQQIVTVPRTVEREQLEQEPLEQDVSKRQDYKTKVFFGKIRKQIVRINRCNAIDYKFVETQQHRSLCKKGKTTNQRLKELVVADFSTEEILQQPSSSIQSGRKRTQSAEKRSTSIDTGVRGKESGVSGVHSLQRLRTPSFERRTDEISRRALQTPSLERRTDEISRRALQEIVTPQEAHIPMGPREIGRESELAQRMEFEPIPMQELVPMEFAEIPIPVPQREPSVHEIPREPSIHEIPTEPRGSPISETYKQRRQKIIEKVVKWDFESSQLTIEDLVEKPFTKLKMAAAFGDLLALAGAQYIRLCSEEDSTELHHVEKGSRLL